MKNFVQVECKEAASFAETQPKIMGAAHNFSIKRVL